MIFHIMSFVLACNISIGQYETSRVSEVEINKSWKTLGNTCVIKLPSLKTRLEDVIKPGDPVNVILYYLGETQNVEFAGYVRRVKPSIPYELECEDEVYLFRKTNINKTWKNTTLKEVVGYIVGEVAKKYPGSVTVSKDLPDVNFANFRINNANAAYSIEQLKEHYGLTAYFRNKQLYVGLAYTQKPGTVQHSLAWNVISNDLTYRTSEDVRLKVTAIGIKSDNTHTEVSVGDDDGEKRTFHYYNITSKADLTKLANEEIQKLKYDGFEGTIETFLYPFAEPLMTCDLFDPKYDNKRNGSYVIDTVVTRFSARGARREIDLGIKVST